MKNPRINESLIIGVDFSKRDDGVLIVGRQSIPDRLSAAPKRTHGS